MTSAAITRSAIANTTPTTMAAATALELAVAVYIHNTRIAICA